MYKQFAVLIVKTLFWCDLYKCVFFR